MGGGTDGHVWKTDKATAIKVFHRELGYLNERDTYARLQEYGITKQIDGFWIPKMVGFDDNLMIVEMDVMHEPPYVIDFAKVKLDRPPEFSEDVLEEWERLGKFRFEHHWSEVKSLMHALESFQVYYLDPQRGNITFPDMNP